MNILNRLIDQLDTLIPFLTLSHEDVFHLLQKEKNVWFVDERQDTLPKTYEIYRNQITRSAFLLGYSYFEVFLADLAREIYKSNPKMLPDKKQLSYEQITTSDSLEEVIDVMVEREILDLFYGGMEKIIEYFENKLQLKWVSEKQSALIRASLMRNCIIHNLSLADDRLAKLGEYKEGEEIKFLSSDVHEFGLIARQLARSLFEQAEQKHFGRNKGNA